jgi:hypothetical protein
MTLVIYIDTIFIDEVCKYKWNDSVVITYENISGEQFLAVESEQVIFMIQESKYNKHHLFFIFWNLLLVHKGTIKLIYNDETDYDGRDVAVLLCHCKETEVNELQIITSTYTYNKKYDEIDIGCRLITGL